MRPVTESEIRASFVNCSRREASQLTLPPDLSARTPQQWERLDFLGWVDPRAPKRAYVVAVLDDRAVGVTLRLGDAGGRRNALCAWCEDVTAPADVAFFVARRGGSAGRNGNTIGTLICADFSCSANARRKPTRIEAGSDPAGMVERRVAGLRERSARFVESVLRTA